MQERALKQRCMHTIHMTIETRKNDLCIYIYIDTCVIMCVLYIIAQWCIYEQMIETQ